MITLMTTSTITMMLEVATPGTLVLQPLLFFSVAPPLPADVVSRTLKHSILSSLPPDPSGVTPVDSVETWTVYAQRLEILDKFKALRKVRQEVAETMMVPDITQPGSSFFVDRIPLSVDWAGRDHEEVFVLDEELNAKVSLWTGDITSLKIDAIVIPEMWNFEPEGAGLVSLVHSKAGPGLRAECARLGIVETGMTVVSKGYGLPANFVFHTAPPPYRQSHNQYDLLQSCYQTSLEAMGTCGVKTLALTCLGTGAKFNQPPTEAAHVALGTVRRWLESGDHRQRVGRIVFAVRNALQQEIYEQLMKEYFPVFPANKAASPQQRLTPEEVEALLLQLPSPPN